MDAHLLLHRYRHLCFILMRCISRGICQSSSRINMGVTGRPQESHAAIGNSILSGIPIGSTCSRYGYNRSVSFSMR